MPAVALMWSNQDKASIASEIAVLQQQGTDVNRVLAHVAQIAIDGTKVMQQNIHSSVNGKNIHAICPFGNVGAYYAYDSGRTALYLLGCYATHLNHYGAAAARLAHVP
jgi:hypothetical protein